MIGYPQSVVDQYRNSEQGREPFTCQCGASTTRPVTLSQVHYFPGGRGIERVDVRKLCVECARKECWV